MARGAVGGCPSTLFPAPHAPDETGGFIGGVAYGAGGCGGVSLHSLPRATRPG
jgi:hypothetical protein